MEAMERMHQLIRAFPDQIEEALKFAIPDPWPEKPSAIVFTGMGGSAIAGALVGSLMADAPVPVVSHPTYGLPAFVDSRTWVFVTSYSGNTEEALSSFDEALERGARIFALSSDGQLEKKAQEHGVPFVKIPAGLPPRAALGYLFTPIYRFLQQAGYLEEDLTPLPDFLRTLREELEFEDSLARDLANKFYLRLPVIYASLRFYPVAHRWNTQINENSKALAHTAAFPEMNHNEITGLIHPEDLVESVWAVFLHFPEDHPRIELRMKETADLISESVLGITHVYPWGETALEHLMSLLYLGDYVSLYLAQAYNQDPVAIPRIDELKRRLSR